MFQQENSVYWEFIHRHQFNLKELVKTVIEIAIFNGEFSFDRTKYGMPKMKALLML